MPYKDKNQQRAYQRAHYKKKSEDYKRYRDGYKDRNRKLIQEAKDVPCADCGKRYPPYVMDFDHLRDKEFNISRAVHKRVSVKRLLDEIAKCDIVCSNCHRIRTNKDSYIVP